MKRLGIFIFFDKDNIVDDYVIYLLNGMKDCFERLVIVSNSELSSDETKKFAPFAEKKDIFIRENIGMDAGALKYLFIEHKQDLRLDEYDEICWFNDTCYGPFCSVKDIFDKMNSGKNANLDFWGLTKHAKRDSNRFCIRCLPEHIQSYFIAIRKNMFLDKCFDEFWNAMVISNDFNNVVENYELKMTKYFADKGYKYGVYCDVDSQYGKFDPGIDATLNLSYELIAHLGFPFVKRKKFVNNVIENYVSRCGNDSTRTIRYIKNYTEYPVDYIFKNLLRLYPQNIIKHNLFNNFIINCDYSKDSVCASVSDNIYIFVLVHSKEEIDALVQHIRLNNVKLYIMLGNSDLLNYIPIEYRDYAILVGGNSFKDCLNKISDQIKITQNNSSNDDKCICFIENENLYENECGIADLARFSYLIDNLIPSNTYIEKVYNLLNLENRVGMFSVQIPYLELHNYADSKKLTEIDEICKCFGNFKPEKCNNSFYKDCSDYINISGKSFYIRMSLLDLICDRLNEKKLSEMENGLLEAALDYICQNCGYFSSNISCASDAICELGSRRILSSMSKSFEEDKLELRQIENSSRRIKNSYINDEYLEDMIYEETRYSYRKRLPIHIYSFKLKRSSYGVKRLKKYLKLFRKDEL